MRRLLGVLFYGKPDSCGQCVLRETVVFWIHNHSQRMSRPAGFFDENAAQA